ncbi:hypothetical protein M406DRAFT_330849 [Cryphonectria parasitica EP155]|uniref:Uncharacterized protein n=1 Tax=Cryphonectria parasitica (strain ATCC 38755 / EP155) TaxID=660469 RepID=A0A9P4Y034_CRYP1|nr:uncharacterized protein M406DRAFT_330849 [Cryphonectria parasitica EP155]KAF3764512.1 hypothetical protein M406DRAFT_330849 [Cryphonectria parasitica EP155]
MAGRVRDWRSEIVALLVALCCLLAIFLISARFNNQQQPNWPYATTLNLSTLIALIATVLRSMLESILDSSIGQLKWRWFRSSSRPLSHMQTFDNASRGSWGSFLFMLSLARPNLATLGSTITLLSIVIGTFTQQAIQTASCQNPGSTGQAFIPIAQTSLRGLEHLPGGPTLKYHLSHSDWAANGGRWNTMLATVEGAFPLDNMTMTQRQREIVNNASFDGILLLMPSTNPCEYPSNYQTYIGEREEFAMPPVKASLCPQLELPGVETLPGYFSVTAAACFFYASLQHYKGSVVNGKLQEEAVQDPMPLQPHVDSGAEAFDDHHCEWRCGFSDPCIVDHVVYDNISANLSSVPGGLTSLGNTTGPTRCLYGFSYKWYRALQAQASLWELIGTSDATEQCLQFSNYTAMLCPKSWWLSDLFGSGNASISSISAFMDRGFASLTDQLRTIGTDWENNLTVVTGTVYETDVCVRFRWTWLVYPLVVVVGTSVLLISMMISCASPV